MFGIVGILRVHAHNEIQVFDTVFEAYALRNGPKHFPNLDGRVDTPIE
jgi:hypothetical protein